MKYTIRLIGDIEADLYKEFSEKLSKIEKLTKGRTGIIVNLEINSKGGDIYTALAFSARMRLSSKIFVVTANGLVASAATLILASGSIRQMTKESWVMVHDGSSKEKGSLSQLETEVRHLRQLEDQWVIILEQLTGTNRKVWADLQSKTTYLDAEQCLKLGLVDKII